MEEIPVEIWKMVLTHCEPLHNLSRVCKLFYTLCHNVAKPCKDLKELVRSFECNDIIRIKLSEDLVEVHADYLTKIVKCKALARYLLDFGAKDEHLYRFDDIYLIKEKVLHIGFSSAVENNAKSIIKYFYGCLAGRDVDDIKEDLLQHRYVILMDGIIQLFINDKEILEFADPGFILSVACRKRNIEAAKYAIGRGANKYSEIYKAAKCDFVEYFEFTNPPYPDKYLIEACMGNATNTIDWILSKGVTFDRVCLENAIRFGHVELVNRIQKTVRTMGSHIYTACKYGKREILDLLLDKVVFHEQYVIDSLISNKHYDVAYELFPCDKTRLFFACLHEDLDTVKELYPSYPKSLFNKFENGSYELLCILYREGDVLSSSVSFGMVKFMVEWGFKTVDEMAESITNSVKTIKYLQSKGAVIEDRPTFAPRVRMYLASLDIV